MKIGYARVSTKDQAVDLQVDALKQAGCAKVYSEVISGARAHRPVLEQLLENLRPGDVLIIWKLDRLGRSLPHLIGIINELTARKVGLKSFNDPLDTTTSHGRLFLNLFASLADYAKRGIMQSHNAKNSDVALLVRHVRLRIIPARRVKRLGVRRLKSAATQAKWQYCFYGL